MAELKHFSHECALTVPKMVENGICNICYKDEPVEYACEPCNFDLCKACSNLPLKVSHDFHMEHPLEFFLRQNDQKPRYIICSGCGNMSSGCFYECKECEIYLDMGCALMENIFRGWDAKELPLHHDN
ncbi:Cysteine/Histidine-rich C1 domain family protein [Raphanus sativus]|nr:Cysteine/Histidine-rich C1 domain family protein [Raphanus sativus]